MSVKFTDIGTAPTTEQLDFSGKLSLILHWRETAITVLEIMIGQQNIICNLYKIFYIAATGADNPSCRFSGWNLYFAHICISLPASTPASVA